MTFIVRASIRSMSIIVAVLMALHYAQAAGMDAAQRHRADQLISIFENGTPEIQYGYAETLGDGRGITAGRSGFTTATGDVLLVVQLYGVSRPDAVLLSWLPELTRLAALTDGDVDGLNGFAEAWQAAAGDPLFIAAQNQINDTLYFGPARAYAEEIGLHSALALAVLYDAIIQHGDGDDPDSLRAMIGATETVFGDQVVDDIDEAAWLRAFLDVRRDVLLHASDAETRAVWAASSGRVEAWGALLIAGNLDLVGPIRLLAGGYDIAIK